MRDVHELGGRQAPPELEALREPVRVNVRGPEDERGHDDDYEEVPQLVPESGRSRDQRRHDDDRPVDGPRDRLRRAREQLPERPRGPLNQSEARRRDSSPAPRGARARSRRPRDRARSVRAEPQGPPSVPIVNATTSEEAAIGCGGLALSSQQPTYTGPGAGKTAAKASGSVPARTESGLVPTCN